jgi:glycosyltransferase involved in cell wall biosynthesis
MKFSVIMASRLENYPSAGHNREAKLVRAVNSVIEQTFEDWELHIVADGCQETVDIIQHNVKDTRLHVWKIAFTKLWSGYPRNKGIDEALGDYIIYLDNDDVYGPNHLQIVNDNLNGQDWVWFNDCRFRPKLNYWYENECDINKLGRHGTSNICHKRELGVRWDNDGKYAHDYYFTRKLVPFKNFGKIATPEYFVCHIPGTHSTGGYDC